MLFVHCSRCKIVLFCKYVVSELCLLRCLMEFYCALKLIVLAHPASISHTLKLRYVTFNVYKGHMTQKPLISSLLLVVFLSKRGRGERGFVREIELVRETEPQF